jgi:hypothetical protein
MVALTASSWMDNPNPFQFANWLYALGPWRISIPVETAAMAMAIKAAVRTNHGKNRGLHPRLKKPAAALASSTAGARRGQKSIGKGSPNGKTLGASRNI